jgi:hypothetical protein
MRRESYVIRIYRRGQANAGELVGIVESPESGRQAPFRGLAQLSAILAAPRRHLHRAARTASPLIEHD